MQCAAKMGCKGNKNSEFHTPGFYRKLLYFHFLKFYNARVHYQAYHKYMNKQA